MLLDEFSLAGSAIRERLETGGRKPRDSLKAAALRETALGNLHVISQSSHLLTAIPKTTKTNLPLSVERVADELPGSVTPSQAQAQAQAGSHSAAGSGVPLKSDK